MTDKSTTEKWETFINAKGPQLEQMSTQQLYSEVRVNAARVKPSEATTSSSNEAKALSTVEFHQAIQALNTRIDSYQRGRGRGNSWRGTTRGGRGGSRGGFNRGSGYRGGRGGRGGRGSGDRNKRPRLPYDPEKYCERHNNRGHSTEECLTLKRESAEKSTSNNNQHANIGNYQPSFTRPRQYTADVTRLIVQSTEIQSTSDPQAWIVDTAANAYITPFKERLHNYREFLNSNEKVAVKGFAGKAEIARGTGSITLTDKAGNRFTLKDVVYVPESPDQILSLMKLRREMKAKFWFTSLEGFEIQLPSGVSFSGRSINDILYIWSSLSLQTNVVQSTSQPNQPTSQPNQLIQPLSCTPQDLWHLRFGHPSTTTLRKHPYVRSTYDSTRCTPCIRAKQTRKPFLPAKSKVTRKLERLHSDLCGPFPTSKGNSVYVLTFLDELTHWNWTTTVSDKSSATVCKEYRNLIKRIETESDLKIKYLRTDGGKEYEGDLRPVLKELGVRHQPTSPHSPQSNGKAERLNRTLEEHARAMLFQANMPKSFWAEAITTAAYLLNRLPSDAVQENISYELWHQKPLSTDDLKSLKPFPQSHHELQMFEEIVVQPPPALQVFKTYGDFQPDNDPPSFTDAMRRPDANLWWEAFCDEIKAIIARETWILTTLPPGKRALPLRWVCRIKRDATNIFEKYKGRIVVKGYVQEAGLDFDETFAPVVRIDSVRTLFAIAAGKDLYIIQVDCQNAFLHSHSDFEIYVQQPEGFMDENRPDAVLLLNKALYGLKQAPRLWYLFLSEVILDMGFQVLETDTSIYIREDITLAVFVDDILITGPSVKACNAVATEISRTVQVVNKGEVRSFLGLNVVRNYEKHAISINQPGYIDYLLAKYNMTNAKSASTPFETGTKLRLATATDTLCNVKLYQELTGSLNHLSVFSRPDITFAVFKLSKYNFNPTTTHFKTALHVLRYLKATRNYCIVYKKSTTVPIIDVIGYSDSDHASDEDDRKSYTGYVFIINGGAVSWSTHKQVTVAFSSMEAEYMALSDAAREALARKQLFQELGMPSASRPVTILTDSQTALDISDNPAI